MYKKQTKCEKFGVMLHLTSKIRISNDFMKLVKSRNVTEDINMLLTDQCPGIHLKKFKIFLRFNPGCGAKRVRGACRTNGLKRAYNIFC